MNKKIASMLCYAGMRNWSCMKRSQKNQRCNSTFIHMALANPDLQRSQVLEEGHIYSGTDPTSTYLHVAVEKRNPSPSFRMPTIQYAFISMWLSRCGRAFSSSLSSGSASFDYVIFSSVCNARWCTQGRSIAGPPTAKYVISGALFVHQRGNRRTRLETGWCCRWQRWKSLVDIAHNWPRTS